MSSEDRTKNPANSPGPGNTVDRLERLRQAVQQTPDSADAHNELGLALGEAGDLNGAAAELEKATRLAPDFAEAYYNLGITYLKW